MIDWTDLSDDVCAWVVDDRPVLLRDRRATAAGCYSDPDDLHMLAENVLGWRVETERMNASTLFVVRMSRRYSLPWREMTRLGKEDTSLDEGSFCRLIGFPAYSDAFRLAQPFQIHPAGCKAIWCSGTGGQPGMIGVVEERSWAWLAGKLIGMCEEVQHETK